MKTLKHDFKGAALRKDLLSQISNDVLRVGDLVLPEKKLAERYRIGYMTVRNVISGLEKEGILKRYKGKGTFVVGRPPARKNSASIQILFSNPSTLHREYNPVTWFVSMDILKGILDCCNDFALQPKLLYYREESIALDRPVIIVEAISDTDRRMLDENNVPYVFVNQPDINTAQKIVCDDSFGAYQSTVHLIRNGYRKIAYFGPQLEHKHFMPRYEGYLAALSEYGLKTAGIIIENTGEISSACTSVMQFLAEGKKTDAIVCATDFRAIGAMDAIRQSGLKVPDDIAVIGFDDTAEAALTEPPLTTVAKPRREMGYQAVKFILEWEINLRNKIFTKILKPELIIRESVREKADREEICTRQEEGKVAGVSR